MSMIKVKNRSDSVTGYRIPDMNLTRDFNPGETKTIDEIELQKLSYQDGGQALIDAYFQIVDKELAAEFSPKASQEPEYWLTEEGIRELILTSELDVFLDALDFAPSGVIELIKKYSVSLPMVDNRKMEAFKNKFGFDIRAAIELNKDFTVQNNAAPARRVQQQSSEQSNGYKVVSRRVQE